MFQDGLFQYVTSQSSVTALLGTPSTRGDKSTGMFAMLATTEALLPYIVFQQVSGAALTHYTGTDPWTDSRWRITCYGSSQKNAVALAKAIRSLFKNVAGSVPITLPDSDATVIQNVWLLLQADDTEALPKGTIFAVHLDYQFQYIDTAL